jgi:hypothetical protein
MLLWEDGIAKKLDIRVQPGEGPDGPSEDGGEGVSLLTSWRSRGGGGAA